MIKAIIIDDEPHCIEALCIDLERHCKSVQICDSCNSGKDGIRSIRKYKPDLIFLDVEMPWMNGFEMLEVLGDFDFSIIFTTAFDQFAARAFRISAVDFLLKPIDTDDLKSAVQKAEEKILSSSRGFNIENLLNNIRQPVQLQKIALPNRDGYEFILLADIQYCSAEGSYTRIILNDKRSLLVSKTLGDIEEMLPQEIFTRVHHSHIVNLHQIALYIRTDGGYLVMNNNEKLMVSKARKEFLLERLGLKKD